MKHAFVLAIVTVCLSGGVFAEEISFSVDEGYSASPLDGQPGPGGWTANTVAFQVQQVWPTPHVDLLWVEIAHQHPQGNPGPVDPAYATKRMIPLTTTLGGAFDAGFSFKMNGQDGTDQQTAIALGQASDSGWGPYFGLNKNTVASLAVHQGAGWTDLLTGLDPSKWYDVEISGDITTGLYDVKVYDEDLRNAGDPAAGLLLDQTGLSFRDSPTDLAYVMLTNEGSMKDTSVAGQLYDDLVLTPEPATMAVLAFGGLVALRRRRR